MKKGIIMCVLLATAVRPIRSEAQVTEVISLVSAAIKKVIVALDLEVQKLQTQTIYLQDAQKELENAMQQLKLNDITDWVQKQEDLYSEYYQELWQIKTAISTYQQVKDIIQKQEKIISDYNTAYSLLKSDPHFSAQEISHMYSVYSGILDKSVTNIEQLTKVINAFVTQMDDGDRLKIINDVGHNVDQNYSDLHLYTQQNIQLSLERAKDEADAAEIMALYGIQ